MTDEEPTEPATTEGGSEAAESASEERVPRPPIVIPKTSRLAIGAVVVVVGLLLLIIGSAALKIVGLVLVAGGVVDLVVGRRQRY